MESTHPIVKDRMIMIKVPATVLMPIARTIAQGTAVAALVAYHKFNVELGAFAFATMVGGDCLPLLRGKRHSRKSL